MSDNDLCGRTTFEHVRLQDMRVVPHCQRENKEAFQASLAERGFDLDLFHVPVLSQRGEVYHVLDAQQRIGALRNWLGAGWETQRVYCQVYHGLTDEEEAAIFLDLNYHLNVSAFDKYDKAVVARREPEATIDVIVRACDLHVARTRGSKCIGAVDAIRKVYVSGNRQILAKTLCILYDAYGDAGLEGCLIKGFGMLCQRYNGSLDKDAVVAKLSARKMGVKELLQNAATLKEKTDCQKPVAIAAAAVEIINAGKGGKKLPSWWRVDSHDGEASS
jgi:hypothetical protein